MFEVKIVLAGVMSVACEVCVRVRAGVRLQVSRRCLKRDRAPYLAQRAWSRGVRWCACRAARWVSTSWAGFISAQQP